MSQLHLASSQWASRPADERFTTIDDLEAAVYSRTEIAQETTLRLNELPVHGVADADGNGGQLYVEGGSGPIDFTYYSFGQLASMARAPSDYLRRLPAPLAAENMNWSLQNAEDRSSKLLYEPANGHRGQVRAFTSETYGRIWDYDVVKAVKRNNQDGRWKVPAASYASSDPKKATTLYASDHDVFLFLVDPEHPIETSGGDTLFRGFVTWNSEVGDRTFGLLTFLYRYVCDNRIIWGAEDVSQLLIRHTKNGPYRFDSEAAPILRQYAEASTAGTVKQIEAAKTAFITSVPKFAPDEYDKELVSFLKDRNYTDRAIAATVAYVDAQGQGPTVWNVVQGLTSFAHNLAYTDARIDLERKASGLMEMVNA